VKRATTCAARKSAKKKIAYVSEPPEMRALSAM
jgi:hypothetical protein